MARKPKHPDYQKETDRLINEILDNIVIIWSAQEKTKLKLIADETAMSASKIRKLLITAGERDKQNYFESPVAAQILSLHRMGKTIPEIQDETGLSYTSVQGYLPYSKIIYSLDSLSTEAERIKLFRSRQAAVSELHRHQKLPDASEYLWRTVIAFEGYVFTTSGRGKNKKGATRFRYTVSRSTGTGGHHYRGTEIEGFGNEIYVEGKEKSISRSTIDLAVKKSKEMGGKVKGPKALGLPGSGSYLYPMLIRFGLIEVAETT